MNRDSSDNQLNQKNPYSKKQEEMNRDSSDSSDNNNQINQKNPYSEKLLHYPKIFLSKE